MRWFFVLSCGFLFSCSSTSNYSLDSGAAGNWLIVYANHGRLTPGQVVKYQPLQDSIVDLYGLKLVQLMQGGSFTEMDSFYVEPGRWDVFQNKKLLVADAGQGFSLFVGEFLSLKNGKLKLVQKLVVDHDSLPITWAWKRIEDGEPASKLFEPSSNEWREKSIASESDAAIKNRLSAMLSYYALYFDLIAAEAVYFLPRRLALPFNYYAHSVGMKKPAGIERFEKCFYSKENALRAYNILRTAKLNIHEKFPVEDNYLKEYAAHFIQLKNALEEPN